jgi:hypothetical protein
MPSRKAHYIKGAKPFEVKDGKPSGNFFVLNTPDITKVQTYIEKIAKQYPTIKTLIIPDFTHYISNVLSNKQFIERKAGGEAFQRFWELAADLLNAFFNTIAKLRDDLVIVMEFHSEFDEYQNKFQIFVPGGKMITEKFKIDSYFDILLYTYCIPDDDVPEEERYKFIIKRTTIDGITYPARSMGILNEYSDEEKKFIPNNLQLVLNAIKTNEHLI